MHATSVWELRWFYTRTASLISHVVSGTIVSSSRLSSQTLFLSSCAILALLCLDNKNIHVGCYSGVGEVIVVAAIKKYRNKGHEFSVIPPVLTPACPDHYPLCTIKTINSFLASPVFVPSPPTKATPSIMLVTAAACIYNNVGDSNKLSSRSLDQSAMGVPSSPSRVTWVEGNSDLYLHTWYKTVKYICKPLN